MLIRSLLIATLLSFPILASADLYPGVKNITEIPTGKPGVYKFRVTEEKSGAGEAQQYLNPNLSDVYAKAAVEVPALKSLIEKVYDSNGCKSDGSYKESAMSGVRCGDIQPANSSNTVLWASGVENKIKAQADRKSILTFSDTSSGKNTVAVIEVLTSVSVAAGSAPSETVGAVFEITIDMTSVKEIVEP